MADLTKLQYDRERHWKRFQDIQKSAKKAKSDENHHIAFKTRCEPLETMFHDIQVVQDKIVSLHIEAGTFDTDAEELFQSKIETTYYEIKTIYNTIFPVAAVTPNPSTSSVDNNKVNARLPKLQVPTFDGTFHMWLSFRDLYNSLIHNNKSLSNMEKFHYLLTSLGPKPKAFLKSIPVAEDHYAMAYKKLLDEYDNKRQLAAAYWTQIESFQNINQPTSSNLKALVNVFEENIQALQLLKYPTEQWDFPLFHMFNNKLDVDTKKAFELEHKLIDHPTYAQLKAFILRYSNVLSHTEAKSNDSKGKKSVSQNNQRFNSNAKKGEYALTVSSQFSPKCYFCQQSHTIYKCSKFLTLPPAERSREAIKLKLCLNCLKQGHERKFCQSGKCRKCDKSHNTLLHVSPEDNTVHNASTSGPSNKSPQNPAVEHLSSSDTNCLHMSTNKNLVLLSTAVLYIYDLHGQRHQCRALLDSGSQSNFMTQTLINKLQLPCTNLSLSIAGINQSTTMVHHKTEALIQSRINQYKTRVQFLVLPSITSDMPTIPFDVRHLQIDESIQLADYNFNPPSSIDLLLGASIFYDLLEKGNIKLGIGKPTLQDTKFGWVISGQIEFRHNKQKSFCGLSLNEQLSKFWEIEEIPNTTRRFLLEEQYCEDYFKTTTMRDSTGRFVVRLPFKENVKKLGHSESLALKRLNNLETKFNNNHELQEAYIEFMHEYITLDHMTINQNQIARYHFPHHAVFKDSKIRVVFDGSARPNDGLSLNDCLCVGPTIQESLFDIVLRFRCHKYVLTADVKKMYRQILVHESDRSYQNILWRNNTNEPIQVYTLKTVTYGTACAPFLAIRCLHEIAHQNKEQFQVACDTILRDFYVDDLLTGTETLESAIQLKKDLSELLMSHGFNLCKWSSNNGQICNEQGHNPVSSIVEDYYHDNKAIKTLGLVWNSKSDTIHFTINPNINSNQNRITKRHILSTISKIFDPLGLLGPITIKGKVFLQRLWQLKIDWDEPIPQEMAASWLTYLEQLAVIFTISTPRVVLSSDPSIIELHAFCDASETAYGVCIYLRSKCQSGYVSNLICAKSRVAPLKKVSIPQLELCGALLLSKLVATVKSALNITIDKSFYWTDSKIVLAWLNIQPCYLKTFVANRVVQITEITQQSEWYHVRSDDNPADLISRGVLPTNLKSSNLWWHGPAFFKTDFVTESYHPEDEHLEIPETKQINFACPTATPSISCDAFSSFTTLHRSLAYALRFINNCRTSNKVQGPLGTKELNQATIVLIKMIQQESFSDERSRLQKGLPLSRSSKLLPLNPFLDESKVLRVGGRLEHATLSFDQKHPIILPAKHKFTQLLIRDYHYRYLHAGTELLLSIIRLKYWPISAKCTIKAIIRNCVKCFRTKPIAINQLMGDLPSSRISVSRAFHRCGVDYAGPVSIKDGTLRTSKIIKSYIALFVCLTTKAVHIELVKDLSTEAFLNCLKRFIARRGKPAEIHSDNGTNFKGASNELKQLYSALHKSNETISNFLSQERIQWHFIPARAPHMGGLWEAAIKSVKKQLIRVVGNAVLNFEAMYTVLVQIEACLNSRPLTPISQDPSDYTPLTPGHFLIGDSLAALPEENVQDLPENRLNRYQYLQRLVQHFWSRWSKEYLATLKARTKWRFSTPNIVKPDELVIIKEDNLPPLNWPLGRIVDVYPGQDKLVRVVSVRLPNGTVLKRPISKVCLLPGQSGEPIVTTNS